MNLRSNFMSSMYTIFKTCRIVPKIITKVRLDSFRDDISISWHSLLNGSPRHLCTSQTQDRHIPYSDKSLAQAKKKQGGRYDPTKYEALRQCAVPRYAYYDDSATDWTDSDSEPEIETVTEEEAQTQKEKILAEAKEEEPFSYNPTINYDILKQFFYLDSPDSLTYSNLILESNPKEELQSKLDKFYCEATLTQVYRIYSKTDDIETEPETETEPDTEIGTELETEAGTETMAEEEAHKDKILLGSRDEHLSRYEPTETKTEPDTETGSELEIETGPEPMAEEEAHKNKILAGAKGENLFCYEPSIKYEPLKRYIVPRFAFFDSSSTDWSDSSSFSDSESETGTMEEKEAQSQEDKILAGSEEKQLFRDNLVKPPSTDLQDLDKSPSTSLLSKPTVLYPSFLVNHGAKSPAKLGDKVLKQEKEMDSYTEVEKVTNGDQNEDIEFNLWLRGPT